MADTAAAETIAHDDECPICQHVLYDPVKTQCNHVLCATCMAQWADTSSDITQISSALPLDAPIIEEGDLDPNQGLTADLADLNASCPMCRTKTTVSRHTELHQLLEERYPVTYAARRAEEEAGQIGQGGIEGMTILIGNHHKREPSRNEEETANVHDWTLFVRFSRPELIDQVRFVLHPTFRPPGVTLRQPPFQVHRLGWGIFEVQVSVLLKHPWTWMGSNSTNNERTPLKFDWMLDFDGDGSQRRIKTKIKNVGRRTGLRSGARRRQ